MLGIIQVFAVAIACLALAFFLLFAGYYVRNRRLALEARDRDRRQGGRDR